MSNIRIEEYNSIDKWHQFSEKEKYCDSCYRGKTGVFFLSEGEKVCLSCVVKELKHSGYNKMADLFPGQYLKESFLETGTITSKLGILLNLEKLQQLITGMKFYMQEELKRNIILTLGYVSGHPLDRLLRSITLKVLTVPENLFFDFLQDIIDDPCVDKELFDKQKFRYNLAHALVHVDRESGYAHDFIGVILDEAGTRGDQYVTNWFQLSNGVFFPRMSLEYSSRNIENLADTYTLENVLSADRAVPVNDQSLKPLRMAYIIDKYYSLARLKIMYSEYFDGLYERSGEIPPFEWPGKKARKDDYVRLFCDILSNDALIAAFLDGLQPWIEETLEQIVWDEKTPLVSDLEREFSLELFPEKNRSSYYDCDKILSKKCPLFSYYSEYVYYNEDLNPTVYLPGKLKAFFRSLLPEPENSLLSGSDNHGKDLFSFPAVDAVSQIGSLAAYISQVGITRGKNGRKILKSTLKEVRQCCHIIEPYEDDKALADLKGLILIELFDNKIMKKIDHQLSPGDLFRKYFSQLFNSEGRFAPNFYIFLQYLKSSGYSEYEEDSIGRHRIESLAINTLLKELPSGKWVSVGNIVRYLNRKDIFPYPFTLESNAGRVLFNSPDTFGYKTININDSNWGEAVLIPYLKTLLFILHTIGVIDVALKYPENSRFQDKKNPWLSPYDGVCEISITALGEWLVGRREEYSAGEDESSVKISLDEKRLLITATGENPLVDITLKRVGEPLGNGCYLVTSASFLSSCETKRDLNNKIRMFRDNISSEPPAVWEEFFSALLNNTDPLKHIIAKRFVFQLDPQNRELIQILFSDPFLKNLVMKAEDYHILIKERDYKMVQNRLAELGYLLPSKKLLD